MTNETLNCPYCNASIAAISSGQRTVCPRCGDSFPLRPADSRTNRQPNVLEAGIDGNATTIDRAEASVSEASFPSRRSNRLVAALVIGLMLLMAGSGLTFMLMTQAQRRAQDISRPPRRPGKQRGIPEPSGLPVVARVAPDKWEALGYLPSGINFLVGARLAELLVNPIGIQVLRDPLKVGGVERPLSDLPSWVGFQLEDIDHLVFGARIEDSLIPPFYLVLRTAQPYDEEQLRQRLKGTRAVGAFKKKLYAFHTLRQNIPMAVWFADDRTVVLALFADQLESLPNRPSEGLQRFSAEIRTILKERREPVAPVWIAGHSADWTKTSAAKFPNRFTKMDWVKLAPLRTFGLWFVPDGALEVKGVFACKDEAGARGLEDYFRALHGADAPFKSALDGPWLTLQFQTEPDLLARWMKH